jgi:hypothetical protein
MALKTRILVGLLCTLTGVVPWAHSLVAQDKDTVWTKATGQGATIVLSWDKNHPWAADLSARGAMLMAKYRLASRQEVVEPLANSTRVARDERSLQFTLPEAIKGDPSGPICLLFQMPNRRTLPIRRSEKSNADTAGFRYEPWEQQVRQRSQVRLAQGRVAAAERALARADQNLVGQQRVIASRGWHSLEACEDIPEPTFAPGERPRQVVLPAEQDDEARRLCTYRAVYGNVLRLDDARDLFSEDLAPLKAARASAKIVDTLQGLYGAAFRGIDDDPLGFVNGLVTRLGPENSTVRARAGDTVTFVRDFTKHSATLRGYEPRLPASSNSMGWPSSAGEAAFRLYARPLARALDVEWALNGVPEAQPRDLETLLGASLDAYAGCVEDANKQLARNYDNWNDLRSSAPRRAAMAHDFLVRECRQEMERLNGLQAERARFADQLSGEQAALTSASVFAPVTGRPQDLNRNSCAAP